MTLPLPLSSALASDEVFSVSHLNATVKRLVEGSLGPIWVRGEVLQCRAHTSGHWYFVLRDAAAQVRCCMWRTYAERAGRRYRTVFSGLSEAEAHATCRAMRAKRLACEVMED